MLNAVTVTVIVIEVRQLRENVWIRRDEMTRTDFVIEW